MSLVVSHSDSDDPYDVLGIGKKSSKEEIKKAYKRKALKTHPDQGGNIEAFRRVNHAYNTLMKDKEYLERYDKVAKKHAGSSSNPANQTNPANSSSGPSRGSSTRVGSSAGGSSLHRSLYQDDDFDDIFLAMLKGFGLSHIINDGEILVSYEELINGGELTTSRIITKVVNEQGRVLNEITCSACNGNGKSNMGGNVGSNSTGLLLYALSHIVPCPNCDGTGRVAPPNCHYEDQEEIYNFYVQPWTAPGTKILVGGQNCTLKVKDHKWLSHEGNDLIYDYRLHLPEAMLGHTNYPLKLGDKKMKLTSQRIIIKNGDEDVLKNQGFLPSHSGGGSLFSGFLGGSNTGSKTRGNLVIRYAVEIPSHLTPAECRFFAEWEQRMLQKALPGPSTKALPSTKR